MTAFGRVVPVLRSFDEAKAREFYLGFLGFAVDFEHRFAPDLPLFLQVSRGGVVLRLSEHHGDGSPGANVTVEATGLDALRDELLAKRYRNARPGIETMPWGTRELRVADPFGNRITFEEKTGEEKTGEEKRGEERARDDLTAEERSPGA